MSCLKLWVVFCILLASSVQLALGQEPIMELYDFVNNDTSNVINNSGCNNGSVNDVDYFTVRGKVNKNGADPNAYKDTNLYLQAVRDPSTNAWASQCRPDLTDCRPNLTTDCYCENVTNGDYDIVMTIMAKSIYSGGKLMLSWNDARSPYNPPITSNIVDYYPGPIWDSDQERVTLEIMLSDGSLVENTSFIETKSLNIPYDPNMTNLTFCVYNLLAIGFIKIEMGRKAYTTTEECVTLDIDLDEENIDQVLNMSFSESGGCERTDSYTLYLQPHDTTTTTDKPSSTTDGSPGTTFEPKKQVTEPWIIVVSCLGGFIFVIIVITFIICCVRRKKKKREPSCQPSTILSSKDQLEGYDNQHEHNGRSVSMSSAGYQHNRKSSPPTTLESTPGAHQQQQYQNDVYTMPRNLAPYQYNVKQTPSSKPGEHHHHYHHRDEYDKITTPVKPASMTSL